MVAVCVLVGASLALIGAGVVGLSRPGSTAQQPVVALATPPSETSESPSPPPSTESSTSSVSSTFSVAAAPASAAGPTAASTPALGLNPVNADDLSTDPTSCALPRFDTSAAGQDAFYQATLACLNRAWEPVLRAANLPFRSPSIVSVTNEMQTPCGRRTPSQTALYCSGTIYMTGTYYRDVEGHGDNAGVYLGQLAHEYGHHIQELAGIMSASWGQRYDAGPESPLGHETSRRFELQATCYGGMFLASVDGPGSVSSEIIDGALKDAAMRGDNPGEDVPDHGSPEHNGLWVRQGHDRNLTRQCNTWLAGAESVR